METVALPTQSTGLKSFRWFHMIMALYIGLFVASCDVAKEQDATHFWYPSPAISDPDWGPDNRIALACLPGELFAEGGIYVLDMRSGEYSLVASRQHFSSPSNPKWSGNGKWIAFHTRSGLYKIDPISKKSDLLFASSVIGSFSWGPGDSLLSFTIIGGDVSRRGLWVISSDGKRAHQLRLPIPEQRCINCKCIFPGDCTRGTSWEVSGHEWFGAGGQLLYLTIDAATGSIPIIRYDSTSADAQVIATLQEPQSNFNLAADQQRVLYNSGARVHIYDLKNNSVQYLFPGLEPRWSHDESKILYHRTTTNNDGQTVPGPLRYYDVANKQHYDLPLPR